MKKEYTISKVKLSEDKEHLYLHTRDEEECEVLWNQLFGIAHYPTEGITSFEYDISINTSQPLAIEVEDDPDQLYRLLEYLAVDCEVSKFLSKDMAKGIQARLAKKEGSGNKNAFFNSNNSGEADVSKDKRYLDIGVVVK